MGRGNVSQMKEHVSCADPESVVRGVRLWKSFFFFFFFFLGGGGGLKGIEDPNQYHYKRAIIDPPAKRHLNGVLLAGRWWPNIEWGISNFVILRGSGPVLLRNLIFLYFFRGVWTCVSLHFLLISASIWALDWQDGKILRRRWRLLEVSV